MDNRHDQSTYLGRLKFFSELTDPRNLLASKQEIEEAVNLVKQVKQQNGPVDEKYWKAKKIVDSTIHPDTQEPILLPFRMASFVPTNVPIIAFMLIPNPSISMILFGQWVNQSVNVAFNYFNANKSAPMSMNETMLAYTAAVGSSCTIAVGLSQWLQRAKVSQSMRSILSRVVPFTAVAAAGTLNVFLMRRKELVDGIQVQDQYGQTIGASKIAGQSAISQVAISRIVTAAPALFVPGLILSRLENGFLKRHPRLTMPLNLLTVTGSLLVALPCAIALFPQKASMKVEKLEPEFQKMRDSKGNPLQSVYFNRGL
ncbi:Tricarboxylate/iron carrier [Gorgonomyces haynaldii]|nr:Tricarboxylate/iron carrier [Gorgonomyces haynaldii]